MDHISVEMLAIKAAKAVRVCGSTTIMCDSYSVTSDLFGSL
jgi:hypothetical protein